MCAPSQVQSCILNEPVKTQIKSGKSEKGLTQCELIGKRAIEILQPLKSMRLSPEVRSVFKQLSSSVKVCSYPALSGPQWDKLLELCEVSSWETRSPSDSHESPGEFLFLWGLMLTQIQGHNVSLEGLHLPDQFRLHHIFLLSMVRMLTGLSSLSPLSTGEVVWILCFPSHLSMGFHLSLAF